MYTCENYLITNAAVINEMKKKITFENYYSHMEERVERVSVQFFFYLVWFVTF